MNKYNKFLLVDKCKNFVRFVHEISRNYPRSEYLLKDQLTRVTFEVLELIITTNLIDENKLTNKKIVIAKLSILDFYLDESYQRKCINERTMKKGSRMLEEMIKMTYGWCNTDAN